MLISYKNALITGAAGFIGFHLSKRLLDDGYRVFGLDNLNDYYDPQLKHDRLEILKKNKAFSFHRVDLGDADRLESLFTSTTIDVVVNLAAQAGVRYSLQNPYAYIDSNIISFMNILENCRHHNIKHLVFSSSSSVYGISQIMPFSEHHNVDHPISLYAATKKSDEMMSYCYSHLYGIAQTGLRFFTVYGPWGRPDMSAFLFTKAILEGAPIRVFNHGKMKRDFTFIDDIVAGVLNALDRPPTEVAPGQTPHRVYNLGNNEPVELMTFIQTIESAIGRKAVLRMEDMQPGDVPATYADIDASR